MRCVFIILIFSFHIAKSQTPSKCGYKEAVDQMNEIHPGYNDFVNNEYLKQIERSKGSFSHRNQTILKVPVVVHVIYENTNENLDDSLVYNQIDVLNEDFRRLNEDKVNTRSIFQNVATDTYIEFELASQDPDGMPTTGITRTQTTETSFMDISLAFDKMKKATTGGVDAWPTNRYLNIWVCDLSFEFNGQSFPSVMGYAYPPANLSNWPGQQSQPPSDTSLQGVAIHYAAFGRNNPLGVQVTLGDTIFTERGRTTTHEVGHYLGLRHIWGDGDCSEDDFMDDTPLMASQSNFNCDSNQNTCTDTPTDFPDMVENYMDYSAESCQNMFTTNQAELMYNVLLNERSELPTPIYPAHLKENTDLAWQVYPIPAKNNLHIQGEKEIQYKEIHDLSGQLVKRIPNNKKTISLNGIPSGLYLLRILSKHGDNIYKKVIIN